jgi:hypothetical protein
MKASISACRLAASLGSKACPSRSSARVMAEIATAFAIKAARIRRSSDG